MRERNRGKERNSLMKRLEFYGKIQKDFAGQELIIEKVTFQENNIYFYQKENYLIN